MCWLRKNHCCAWPIQSRHAAVGANTPRPQSNSTFQSLGRMLKELFETEKKKLKRVNSQVNRFRMKFFRWKWTWLLARLCERARLWEWCNKLFRETNMSSVCQIVGPCDVRQIGNVRSVLSSHFNCLVWKQSRRNDTFIRAQRLLKMVRKLTSEIDLKVASRSSYQICNADGRSPIITNSFSCLAKFYKSNI